MQQIATHRRYFTRSNAALRRARWLYATQFVRRALALCLTDNSREKLLERAAVRAIDAGLYAKPTSFRIVQLSILSKICTYEVGPRNTRNCFKWHMWVRDNGWTWSCRGLIRSLKFTPAEQAG